MTVSPEVYLAQELVDHICGYMDKPSLLACSTLSCFWNVSIRPFLFRTIIVTALEASSMHRFLLTWPSSRFAQHIKCLEIYDPEHSKLKSGLEPYHLSLLLAELPAVHTLALSMLYVQLTHAEPNILWPSPRPMREICLKSIIYDLPGIFRYQREVNVWATEEEVEQDLDVRCALVELFNLFSGVDQMTITNVQENWAYAAESNVELFLSMSKAARRRLSSTFYVQRLSTKRPGGSLGHDSNECTLEILKAMSCPNALQTLELQDGLSLCNSFLINAGRNVRHLRLVLWDLHMETDPEVPMVRQSYILYQMDVHTSIQYQISSCPELMSLSVSVHLRYKRRSIEEQLSILLRTLVRSPSTTIHLAVGLIYYHPGLSMAWISTSLERYWEQVDETLSKRQGLAPVKFKLRDTSPGDRNWAEEEEAIGQWLPRLKDRSLLHFYPYDSTVSLYTVTSFFKL